MEKYEIIKMRRIRKERMKIKKTRNKILLIMLAVMVVSFFVLVGFAAFTDFVSAIGTNYSSSANYPNSANIEVASLKYEPYPVEPGEYFSLWVKVENRGEKEAKNVLCVLELEYPFYLDPGISATKIYGKLGSLQQAVLKFEKIRVDENAVEGDNEVKMKCSADGGATWIVKEFNISIQTRYATLNIRDVKTIPQPIAPGSKAQLLITLENLADSSMKDIHIALNLSNAQIAPSGEIPEKKIRRINAGELKDLFFNVIALPNAEGGIYKIPLTLNYTDELGEAYNTNSMISIEIGAKPEIYAVVDSTTIHKRKRIGEITIKIVNKGLTDMKFLDVNLLDGKGYKIISSPQVYIGDLDSDDYETIDFRLAVNSREIILPLKIEYKDTSNKQYSEQIDLVFNMVSAKELGEKQSKVGIVLLIIVILIVIFIVYRNWKKRNQGRTFSDFLLVVPRALKKKGKK